MNLEWSKDDNGRHVAKGSKNTYVIVRDKLLQHYVPYVQDDTGNLILIDKVSDRSGKRGYFVLASAKAAAERTEEHGLRARRPVPGQDPLPKVMHTPALALAALRLEARKLLHEPAALLSPGVFERLPQAARIDFEEGCKTLAFGLSTPAACLLLRSAETAFRSFHGWATGRTGGTWDQMEADLNALSPGRDLRPLTGHLMNLRRSYRNPTMHAEKVYDIEEAQDLLNLCTIIFNYMDRLRQKTEPCK